MSHFVLVTLPLFAAIMFVGIVFFEVLILEAIRKPVGRDGEGPGLIDLSDEIELTASRG